METKAPKNMLLDIINKIKKTCFLSEIGLFYLQKIENLFLNK